MVTSSELLRVPAFADLPEDQIEWFLSHAEERTLRAGDVYVRQGDPADTMFVLLEGEFQWRGEFGGETVAINNTAGNVNGALPFSRMKQFAVTGRALSGADSEDSGAGQASGRRDVGPHPRNHPPGTTARSAGRTGKTCRWA